MATITCKIPEQLDAELEAMARRRRVSKSEVVRQAIEKQVRSESSAQRVSAFELVKHLCGCLKGPADLSTSPKHLEGFGG